MIRTVRAMFFAFVLRERLLLVALTVIAAVVWASHFGGRARHFVSESRRTGEALAQQSAILAGRSESAEAARQAASRLEASKTLDGTRLLAAVATMAREAGLLTTSIGEPQDVSNGQFAVHTLQLNISKADWASLKAFYLAIQQRSPYIGIEQFAVQADRTNAAFLNVSMKLSSVEIVRRAP
jgi:glutathione S-transferase